MKTDLLLVLPMLALQNEPRGWPGMDELPAIVEQHGLRENLESFRAQFATLLAQVRAERRLSFFEYATREPWKAPRQGLELTDRLAAAAGGRKLDLGAVVDEARALCDQERTAVEIPERPLAREIPFSTRIADVEELLRRAAAAVDEALADVDPIDRPDLREALLELFDELTGTVYVHEDPDHVAAWESFKKIRMGALLRAAALLAPLADLAFAERFYASLQAERPPRAGKVEGVRGTLLYACETDLGWILVGSAGANEYDLPVAFLFDLGGDDRYGPLATRSDLDQPINVVIDRADDDRYEADEDLAQGAGILGVSLLVDIEGKDHYRARRLAQGAGLAGVGMLVDHAGDDVYEADALAQGVGAFGTGIFVDRAGDDQCTSHLYSQGFGAPSSVGILIDARGDDVRTARGKYPSSYGTENEFSSFSMGSGLGFRTLDLTTTKAAGGVGVLLDCEGNDRSTVGEFGFGVGYFAGSGIVRDLAGDDEVHASRYGIATGAHYGLGIVLDDGGNDLWSCPYTASCAGNWDLTLSYLFDASGDDRYVSAGIGLGSATITSLAVLVDSAGKDEYQNAGDYCFGNGGHEEDILRASKCISLFVDLGGGEDSYPPISLRPAPDNGTETVRRKVDTKDGSTKETGVGVFVDR